MLKKQIVHVFGKTYYLIGKDEAGVKWYMQKPTWDCGWYWGFGYLDSFTNGIRPEKSKDILGHMHLSSLMDEFKGNGFDALKHYFPECALTDDELFEFIDYIKSGYTLRDVAELFERGHSNYTEKAKVDSSVKPDWAKEINEKMIPAINRKLDELLSPEDDRQESAG